MGIIARLIPVTHLLGEPAELVGLPTSDGGRVARAWVDDGWVLIEVELPGGGPSAWQPGVGDISLRGTKVPGT